MDPPVSEQRFGFIIYDSAEDYPGRHVCRRFSLAYNPPVPDAGEPMQIGTLKVCRAAVPVGLTCIGRDLEDTPAVVETWV